MGRAESNLLQMLGYFSQKILLLKWGILSSRLDGCTGNAAHPGCHRCHAKWEICLSHIGTRVLEECQEPIGISW